MTGIAGGLLTGDALAGLAERLYQEPWYRTARVEDGDGGAALVEHGDRDSGANRRWQGDGGVAVVHGVLSATGDRSEDPDDLFPVLLDDPAAVLSDLEGPFALAAVDTTEDRVVLATDKAGSRPLYYADDERFAFASEVKALLPYCRDPTVDVRGVTDLLQMGYVVGERTLVEGVRALPPATLLTHTDGETTVRPYWRPSFDRYPQTDYPSHWLRSFSGSVDDVAGTVDSDLSLWLSGGIDSRVTAAALRANDRTFDTLTYYNKTGKDPDIAAAVADSLGVENRLLEPGTPGEFVEGIERSVAATDAMMSWAPFVNLSFSFSRLHDEANVVMEGGTFMGEDIWLHALEHGGSPAETLRDKKGKIPTDTVRSLVTESVDPLASLREEVSRAGLSGSREQTLYGMRQLYAYSHMRSNIVQRSQVGTRVLSHGDMLDAALEIPDEYRMRTLPGTDGKIPAGVPKLKLAVTRQVDSGLDEIRYDRTSLPPSAPYLAHVAGFGLTQVRERLGSEAPGGYLRWYREDPTVGDFVDGTVDDAAERPFLDADAVYDLRAAVRDGQRNNLNPVGSLSAMELWLQRYLD
jgi:asparagine synthase (glutamine-hydrolysing)